MKPSRRDRLTCAVPWGSAVLGLFLLVCGGCRDRPEHSPQLQAVGSSMEPALAGHRVTYFCSACKQHLFWSIDPRSGSSAGDSCCWCGDPVEARQRELPHSYALEPLGDRLPALGDIIAFGSPPQVKRVVALPGQSLAIAGGDLMVDGQRLALSPRQLQRRLIPCSAAGLDRLNAGFRSDGRRQPTGRLAYAVQPIGLYPRRADQTPPHRRPLLDESWWDAGESRSLEPVDDLAVQIVWTQAYEGPGPWSLIWFYRGRRLAIECDFQPAGTTAKFRWDDAPERPWQTLPLNNTCSAVQLHGDTFSTDSEGLSAAETTTELIIAVIDRAIFVYERVSDRRSAKWASQRLQMDDGHRMGLADEAAAISAAEPKVDASRCGMWVPISSDAAMVDRWQPIVVTPPKNWSDSALGRTTRVMLLRDIYYRGPGDRPTWTAPAGEGYLVLGDHVAASVDSRHFDDRIPTAAILGRVPAE